MEIYKAIKYIRLSFTDDKTVESDSVGNQRRMIDDFIAKHPEIEAVAEKIDDGYSGVLFDRPAFQEMMEMVKRGEANCVIVKDLSRLGREYIETGRYLRRIFPAYNVRFIAINDNVDTLNDGADDLAVSVKNIMNEAYSRDISMKTRSALEAKRKNGDFVGPFCVYGYIKSGNQHKKLIIDPYAAGVVRDIFRMRLDGFSAKHIAEELNGLGILSPLAYRKNNGQPCPSGGFTDREDCKWSAQTVTRILQEETYTGTLLQGRQSTPHFKLKEMQAKPSSEWIRVEEAHEAIVSKQDYELAQRLQRLDTRTSANADRVYLFSGMLVCGCCGGHMTRRVSRYHDKEYVYYFCPTGKKHGCANGALIKEEEMIACVQESLRCHIENVASLESILTTITQEQINRELVQEYQKHLENCENQIKQVAVFKSKLYESLITGCLNKDEYLLFKKQYNDQYGRFEKAMAQWQEKISDVLDNKGERNRWMNHFLQFSKLEKLDRRAVTHLIRFIRVISKTEIDIHFNYQDEYQKAAALAAQAAERTAI